MKDAERKNNLENTGFDSLSSSLKHSYEHADRVMKSRATSFYQAFQQLDPEDFRDIAAIYAFCRYVDDIADGELAASKEEAFAKLNQVEREVQQLYTGQVCKPYASQTQNTAPCVNPDIGSESNAPRYEWWEAFARAVQKRNVPLRALLLQLEGQRSDVVFRDLQTLDDLIVYCLQVAGSVGIMLSPMIRNRDGVDDATKHERVDSCSDEHYHRVCESLGIAMQITNILRDIGEDLRRRNRVYVPKALMDAHGVTRNDLERLAYPESALPITVPDNIKALWEEMAQIAERYYSIFLQHLELYSKESRRSVLASAILYRAILDAVRDHQYDCFTHRCYVSEEKKRTLIHRIQEKKE